MGWDKVRELVELGEECHWDALRVQLWECRVLRTDKRREREGLGEVVVQIQMQAHGERLFPHFATAHACPWKGRGVGDHMQGGVSDLRRPTPKSEQS